jgi:heme/copper-type cytochrome/quinol oxidase subunit 2
MARAIGSSREQQTKFTGSSAGRARVEAYALTGSEAIGMHDADGADWIWMTFGMGAWVIVVGLVVYVAVRLAMRDRHQGER